MRGRHREKVAELRQHQVEPQGSPRLMSAAFVTRLKSSRIVRGISANVYSQLVQTALQLLSVPIYATHWGLATYGAWLVIFTVPNYLAFADFGFAAAAANDMTVSVARGDRAAAIETFHAVRAAMAGICSILLLVCVAAVYCIPDRSLAFVSGLSHVQARHAILMLAAYGVLSIQNSVSLAAFRSIGKYATGTYLHTSIHFAENLGALIVVSLGGNIETAAATYLTVGLVGTAVRMVWLRAQAGWLVYFSRRVSFGQVRRLMNPALAVLALPVAQALFLQGTVAVVGLAAGSAAVPAFTTVRTLSRIGLQLTMIVNNAVVPEFTMAALDHTRRARLAFMSIASSAVILVPMFLVVVVGGPLVLKLWTHGAIHAPYALIVLMALTMVVNGGWMPISNLIFALNRHSQYSYYYLAAAAGSVMLSYPLVKWLGSPGAALSLLGLDCVMFARVWMGAMALKVFDPKEVWETAVTEGARLRQACSGFAARMGFVKPPGREPPRPR
jgi:O-antigen/teichoic acid export membrane protein